MKAVLKYRDREENHSIIHGTLALDNIEILKFRLGWDIYSTIVIRIKDYKTLSDLVYRLNQKRCGVILVKTMPDSIWEWLKK